MPFHRYITPTYNLLGGAFPGTIGAQVYDLVNVASGGVGGGEDGSANADSAKAAPHVNAGTYFVAFGEDATSSFANRGMRALSENTDFLDNIVRGSIQRPASTAATLAAASSYTLTGIEAWCGDTVGESSIESLFEVVDSAGGQIYNSVGTKIYVTSVDDGSGGTVVGTGFVTSPRIFLNDAYTGSILIRYLARTSLARIQELPERYRDTRLLMQAATDATYGASFYLHGLNDMYRRGTSISQDFGATTADTPGNGATICRDGQALRVWSPWIDGNQAPPAGDYPDPFLSNFIADYNRQVSPESDTYRNYDGNIGFLNLYPNRTTWSGDTSQVEAGEPQGRGRFHAGFMSAFPLNVDADTLTLGGSVWTRLKIGTPGTTSGAVLSVTSPYYVGDPATLERAIVNDLDMVEVTFTTSAQTRVYLVSSVDPAANTITLKTLAGVAAVLPTDTCTFTLWQVTYQAGGNGNRVYCGPRPVNAVTPVSDAIQSSYFAAPDVNATAPVFRLGYFDRTTGNFVFRLNAYANGTLDGAGGGYVRSTLLPRALQISTSVSYTIVFQPFEAPNGISGAGYSQISFGVTGTDSVTLTIVSTTTTYYGTECEFVVDNQDGATITMVWGAVFVFSDESDSVIGANNEVANTVTRWRGRSHLIGGAFRFLMERVGDYTY